MEKQSVEDSFKRAFQEAEMPPSADVWTHIELDIEKEAGSELRKRVVYYRWMAAASLTLAVSLAGIAYYFNGNKTNQLNAIAQTELIPEINPETEKAHSHSVESSGAENAANDATAGQNLPGHYNQASQQKTLQQKQPVLRGSQTESKRLASVIGQPTKQNGTSVTTGVDYNPAGSVKESENLMQTGKANKLPPQLTIHTGKLPPLVNQRPYKLYFPKTEPDQIDLLLASIEMEEKAQKKDRDRKETLWTSVSMAAGTYYPTNTSSSPNIVQNTGGALDFFQGSGFSNQVDASGYSFSSGVSMGGKISERWTLQGGVNYLAQNSNYSSNTIIVDRANNFSLASVNNVKNNSTYAQASAPYVVNSTLKYFNLPLQAGYLIINNAFGWQVLGGISTDFFLQNTLSAEDAGLNKVSQRGGEDSPYRTVNFSGLLGTEISYRFGDHYRVAINPGLRYPFNSIYKSDLSISSSPITFDVGLKFHYIFR